MDNSCNIAPGTATRKESASHVIHRKKRWSIKSCLAVFLTAVITVTTVHSQVLYVQAEDTADTRTRFTFLPLSSEQANRTLDKKGTLEDTLALLQLPASLPVTVYGAGDGSNPENPTPTVSDGNAAEDTNQTEAGGDATDNTQATTSDGTAADSSSTETGDDNAAGGSTEQNGQTTGGSTEQNSQTTGGSSEQNGQATGDSSEQNGQTADASSKAPLQPIVTDVTTPAVYSAPEETPAAVMTSDAPEAGSAETAAGEEFAVLSAGTAAEEEFAALSAGIDAGEDTSRTEQLEITSWSCENYDEIRESYVFTPIWNNTQYHYIGESNQIPTVTVTFTETPGMCTVSDENELRAAFSDLPTLLTEAKGAPLHIVLTDNIPLTDTLCVPNLPENTSVTLESKADAVTPFSLTRGVNTNTSTPFTGAMLLYGDGAVTAAEDGLTALTAGQGGTLTLKNITIDGKIIADTADSAALSSETNRVNAPAVISSRYLILGEGTRVVNNYNFGTWQLTPDGNTALDEAGTPLYAIPPCGGGLWVRGGTLELQKGCRIQYNTAEQFGGGIYLGSGAVLRCYTEAGALTGNTAVTGGVGADLYACAGSTIYYDPTVFIPWSSFYLDEATLIPEGGFAPDTTNPVEIYLHVCEGSGYSYQEVKDQIESAFGDRVTVLLPHTYMIDTTDLRNWYVYDHYDTNCWDGTSIGGVPVSWQNAYKEYKHRPYYSYNTTQTGTNTVKDNEISAWLENPPYTNDYLALAPLKEHIYSRTENGRPEMSFVGYDVSPNVDFLFYDPQSAGQKTVEFDVDSSMVNTHTLLGTGFLLNTGIVDKDFLSGYLLFYRYVDTRAADVALYKFDHVNIKNLHDAGSQSSVNYGIPLIVSNETRIGEFMSITNWTPEMSIKIQVDSDKITLTQHPKNEPATAANTFTCTWPIENDTDLNGFGPLVAYSLHGCYRASSFTYSNLRMQFTNPDEEKNLLSSLTEADFTQGGNVKRYFMNLLGNSQTLSYGGDSTGTQLGDQYLEYLYMMQDEGIGLITDAETGFKEYLGPTNIAANLFEIPNPNKSADLNRLIANLQTYLSMYPTTELPKNLAGTGLTPANATKPVGNIYLTGADNVQLKRVINANTITSSYIVNVMDNACDPLSEGYTANYYLRKPGSSEYLKLPLGLETENTESSAALFSVPGRAGGVSFVITNDPTAWPTGLYTVKQEIDGSSIHGYSYFTLTRDPLPVEDPEEVPVPQVVPDRIVSTSAPSQGSPEITVPSVTQDILPSGGASGASQPKTGDGMFPAMPVACGACTAFMLKIMLWMYDMDFEAITELKLDAVQSLISWGKGAAKPRIYLAIAALTVVITAYHILKALYENSRQFVRERFGRA